MDKNKRAKITRDGILFITGLAGIVYETVVTKTDRPELLLLFGAMVGLPAFLHQDDRGKRGEDDDGRNEKGD